MPNAKETFEISIKDATQLLDHFKAINTLPPPPSAEVLKRASLITACTAWETYVEDRVRETVTWRLAASPSFQNEFIDRHLQNTLKQFHNPDSDKTIKLFKDFLGVDVSEAWVWPNYSSERARKDLDTLIKKRGEAVHRSKAPSAGVPVPHLITKDQLETAIRLVVNLVEATDKATALSSAAQGSKP
ncbi:HEPN domain-containing protein [Variovorax saccharolyticus]|uniref:HEPN domain-containing protein n=1 Tax=Variovorax saccharolyticus TaxID=3053516 RepID=UPI002576FD16|nr:HEPN domain-containing protein [Variovorax sp. J31P216]MDM0029589.1 HEPN domain-containing protein [Variovorax sp. J31P216]